MTRELHIRSWANREAQDRVEARVLAEILTNPAALPLAPDLEVYDFTDLRLQAAFIAVRELEASGADIGLLEVADAIAMRDLAMGTHRADSVSVAFLGLLVLTADRYDAASFEHVFAADIRQLRLIANERKL